MNASQDMLVSGVVQTPDAGAAAAQGTRSRRLIAAGVAMACTVVLGMAAWLTPSPTGLATHEALNLPPCGWIAVADLPCPTCGMTTAFAHAANGDLLASFVAQPLGFLLAIACTLSLFVSIHVALTGSRLWHAFARLWTPWSPWILAALVVVAWVFKIVSYKGWI